MADTTIVQDDGRAAELGIDLPEFGVPDADTSYKMTVGGRKPQRDFGSVLSDVANDVVTPSAHSDTVNDALTAGYSKADVSSFLQQSQGLSPEDADYHVIDSVATKIKEAQKAGYTPEQVQEFLIQKRMDPTVIDQALKVSNTKDAWKNYEYKPTKASERAQDLTELYTNVHSKYSTLGNQVLGIFDNREAANQANQDIADLNEGIINILKKNGINASVNTKTGELEMTEEDGATHPIDQSFLNAIGNSKFEVYGSVAGGTIGGAVGFATPVPGGTAMGAVGGSMVGAAAGRGLDLAINSYKLKEALSHKLYTSQMVQAGIFDGVASVIGGTIVAGVSKGVMAAYKRYLSGNVDGALKYLLNSINMTKEQAADIMRQWEATLHRPPTIETGLFRKKQRPMTEQEKTIAAVSSTQLVTENFVADAAARHARLANVVKNDISLRSKALVKVVHELGADNTGELARRDLSNYSQDVKDFYGQVKQVGIDAVTGTDFKFDFESLAIDPIMKNIEKSIPVAQQEQFLKYSQKIAFASSNRSFEGLIDLRQAINEFKGSKMLGHSALATVNTVLNKIDAQIPKIAHEYIPHPKQWLENFAAAKAEYAKMKSLEENLLWKKLTKKGTTEHDIRTALSKYSNSKNVDAETFNPVVERLSPATRARVEMSAIKNLTEKYTFGEGPDLQVTHFPALAQELAGLNITTATAKNVVQVVNDFAKVFKNDIMLSGINTGTTFGEAQSAMSSNLLQKAKYGVMQKIWEHLIIKNLPTQRAQSIALVDQIDKLLKNPMHAKTAEDLIKTLPPGQEQDELRSLVKELQVQTAKLGPPKHQDFVNYYKQSKSGAIAVTNGAIGKGIYLFKKVTNPTAELNVVKHEVNMSRMATLKDISTLVGYPVNEKDLATIPKNVRDNLYKQLQNSKYLGISLDDKVMLFPESTIQPKVKKGK